MTSFSLIRNEFPFLKQLNDAGKPLVYLDNAATTQKPQRVLDAIQNYYVHNNANIHRGIYSRAMRATDEYESARKATQEFVGAKQSSEIIFTRGATEAINLVAQSFARPRLRLDDEVLVTAMEHHANLIPWQVACQQIGAILKVIPITRTGELNMEAARTLITSKTRIMAIVHISNTLGTINPVAELIALAKEKQIPVLLDAAQSAMTEKLDVQSLDCDFLVFSGHKVFAPTGIGVLYGKSKWLEQMPPYHTGGSMIRTVTFKSSTFAKPPQKFEAGTPNISGAVALAEAIRFINETGKDQIKAHVDSLTAYALERLNDLGAKLIGKPAHRSAIISFLLDDIHPHDLATILDQSEIAIRAGHHCTQPLMKLYKIPATARISFSVYNTFEEIDLLIDGLKVARKIFT